MVNRIDPANEIDELANLSLAHVAEEIGIDNRTLARYRNGEREIGLNVYRRRVDLVERAERKRAAA